MSLATELVARHDLTLFDAAYAAVAANRKATLATLARTPLEAGFGTRPSELAVKLAEAGDADP